MSENTKAKANNMKVESLIWPPNKVDNQEKILTLAGIAITKAAAVNK
jgi:hypothetical protein